MADLAPIIPLAPTTSQSPASQPATPTSDGSFGTVFNDVVTSQQQGNSSDSSSQTNNKFASQDANQTSKSHLNHSDDQQFSDSLNTIIGNDVFSASFAKTADVADALLKEQTHSFNADSVKQDNSGDNLTPQLERAATSLLTQLNRPIIADTGNIPKADLSFQQQSGPTVKYTDLTTTQSVAVTNEPILSSQLRELVNANETGPVTITRQPASEATLADLQNINRPLIVQQSLQATPAAQPLSTAQETVNVQPTVAVQTTASMSNDPLTATISQLTRIATATGDVNPEKPVTTKLETLRQDAQGQFLQAKVEAQNKNNTGSSNQQTGQQEVANPTQGLTTQPQISTTEQATAFSQTLSNVQNPTSPQAPAVTPQPVTLPPGTQTFEDNIINQVAERFQVNLRNQETQLQIKLQPAELGELKIDLTMKDGAIRAHVIAQSGQVQEILEKNMAKLKEVLEDQGLTVEEILVSHKPDNSDSFDLLHEHLAKHDRPSPQTNRNIDTSFNETFEDIVTDTDHTATGVNIQA